MNNNKNADEDIYLGIQTANNRAETYRTVTKLMRLLSDNIIQYHNYGLPEDMFYRLRIRIRKGSTTSYISVDFKTNMELQIPELGYVMDACDFCERVDLFMSKISSGNYGDVVYPEDIDSAVYNIMRKCNDDFTR